MLNRHAMFIIVLLSLCSARLTASVNCADTLPEAAADSVVTEAVDSLYNTDGTAEEDTTFSAGFDSVMMHKPQEADTLSMIMRTAADAPADTAFTLLKYSTDSAIDSLLAVQPSFRPDPMKSIWYALAFPGLGQIYNRKYWKLPIVYGGVAGIAYAITWNGKYYNDYYNAYRDYMDSNPNTNSYLDLIPENYPEGQIESYLNSRQSTYRRYRDLSIIIGVAFYAITVIDAFVDAQLAEFDISPDLTMKVRPKLMEQPNTAEPSVGCALQVNF